MTRDRQQAGLFSSRHAQTGPSSEVARRGGPPNRMNDLDYTTWMKFQKSFFAWSGVAELAKQCAHFFTKATWTDGTPGRILFLGDAELREALPAVAPPRCVAWEPAENLGEVLERLRSHENGSQDFALISLLSARRTNADASVDRASAVCAELRRILVPDRYCCVVLPSSGGMRAAFPLPWAWAAAGRATARLRDEKVGVRCANEQPVYCMFFQACEDTLSAEVVHARDVQVAGGRQKVPTWVIPKPPPRKPGELLHPAKFPETLVKEFISVFTKPGDTVLDPMLGTGSSLVAASSMGRSGIGVELVARFAEIARRRLSERSLHLLSHTDAPSTKVVTGNALKLLDVTALKEGSIDYCVTSPPYWSMLRNPGSENQRARRARGLQTAYSENPEDLGNARDYGEFLSLLERVYDQVAAVLKTRGALTVVVKNVKREHTVYPLAWDLVFRLCGSGKPYEFCGCTLWCQDDVALKPFAVGTHWVSNTLHQYCLHLRKRT